MLISPTALAGKSENQAERLQIAPYIKEYTARWYNAKYSAILDAWLDIIFSDKKEITVSAFGNELKGFDARYKLIRESALTKTI